MVKRATGTIGLNTGVITWGAATALTAPTALPANTRSYVNGPTGVAANTLYQYQVNAVNGALNGAAATVISATPTAVLAAPTLMQAQGAPTATTLGIQWQASTSALATGYEIQRCLGTSVQCGAATAAWAVVGTVSGPNLQQFIDKGPLVTKTTYTHRVRTVNSLFPALASLPSALLQQKTR